MKIYWPICSTDIEDMLH